MKTFKEQCRIASLATLIVIASIFMISGKSLADMCCYVVPVEVTLKNGVSKNGFLILYGNEIRGFEKDEGPVMKTISFGMNMTSTAQRIWDSLDYAFDVIEISNTAVTIRIAHTAHTVHRVNHFFTDKGLPFSPTYRTSKEGLLRYELNSLPMSELRLVRRTGKIRSLPPYGD